MNRNKIIIMSAMSKAHKHSPAELPESKEQSVRVMRYLVWLGAKSTLHAQKSTERHTNKHTHKSNGFLLEGEQDGGRERIYSAEFQQVWYSLIICICECVFRWFRNIFVVYLKKSWNFCFKSTHSQHQHICSLSLCVLEWVNLEP